MAITNVPTRHRDVIVAMTRLPQDDLEALATALSQAGSSQPSVLAALGKFLVDRADMAFEALLTLTVARLRDPKATPATTALDLVALVADQGGGSGDLTSVLESGALVRLAKVSDLSGATRARLISARVLTDLRPLYDDDPDQPIKGMIVLNTLEISYVEAGRYRDVYLTLDQDDLLAVRDQADRALIKTSTAEQFIRKGGAEVLSAQDEG